MITVEKFIVNPLQENTYLVYDETKECIIIDAGFHYNDEKDEIIAVIGENGFNPSKLVNTHCHFDHLMGAEFIRKTFNIPFFVHPEDAFWIDRAVHQGEFFGFKMDPVSPPDQFITEEGIIEFGKSELHVIHLPGHSPGHVVFYAPDDKFVIAGDVLFYGSIGRTDLPGGDYHTLISAIKDKIFCLPDDVKVYCGHGPDTAVGFEKRHNPFLRE